MYADRVEAGTRRSVKERLNGNAVITTGQRRVTGKRRREDDKWEHDLFEDDATPQLSNNKIGARDLRLKLQKKGLQPASRVGRNSVSGVKDLREKLSGTMTTRPVNAIPPKSKLEVARPTNKSTDLDANIPLVQKVAIQVPKRKTTQKADTPVDEFLQSLGLEKYVITFQAEEVDMTALIHMTDDDLKAMGIPMGPRKKIILALESRKV